MKKRVIALTLAAVMAVSLTACGSGAGEGGSGDSVKLNVTTTFAGEDGNAQNFKNAVAAWEKETGNTVEDASATSDETFKTRVLTDFETGSEPDVLFFFNGADANNFIEAGKVVSIDEIRKEYPDYAANMNDDLITASLVDGKKYAVPVNGFWEAMFVNTEVLDAAGVSMPGADYTWDQFKADCQKINAGEQTAALYTRDKAVMRKLDTLVANFPGTYKLKGQDEVSKTYSFPKSYVSYRKPRTVSTEQRERARQMMIAKNKAKGD